MDINELLPLEVIKEIISYLPIRQQFRSRTVSRKWKSASEEALRSRRTLTINPRKYWNGFIFNGGDERTINESTQVYVSKILSKYLPKIEAYKVLTKANNEAFPPDLTTQLFLCLEESDRARYLKILIARQMDYPVRLTSLQSLTCRHITNLSLLSICTTSRFLSTLDIGLIEITDPTLCVRRDEVIDSIRVLSKLPDSLTEIRIKCFQIDQLLAILSSPAMTSVVYLNLDVRYSHSFSNAYVQLKSNNDFKLQTCHKLQNLHLTFRSLDSRRVELLSFLKHRHPHLESMTLGCEIRNKDLFDIYNHCSPLKHITLDDRYILPDDDSNDNVDPWIRDKDQKQLALVYKNMVNLICVKFIDSLESLHLAGPAMTTSVFTSIGNMRKLSRLIIGNSSFMCNPKDVHRRNWVNRISTIIKTRSLLQDKTFLELRNNTLGEIFSLSSQYEEMQEANIGPSCLGKPRFFRK